MIAHARASGVFDDDPDMREIVEHLESAPIDTFPYAYRYRYIANRSPASFDAEHGLHYVTHNGRRLYWHPQRNPKRIPADHASLLSEQDERSPHRYLASDFDVGEGDIIADVGCAEANFTLDVIDRIRHAYLFETDPRWITALQATFAPWKDKVTIVQALVGRESIGDTIALDNYFADKAPPTFLKLDVEGHEAEVLQGAAGIIRSSAELRAAVCTYHRQEDLEDLTALLQGMGMEVQPSRGYMLLHRSDEFEPPYFRRGLVRARFNQPASPTTADGSIGS